MSLLDALNHCKRRRPAIRPNNGFFVQLRQLDTKTHGKESMPLQPLEYAAWCLRNPEGKHQKARMGCVIT